MSENLHAMLTIGDLAARVGMQPATLREWERRHGFPVPQRLPSGHRRYPPAAAEQVGAVLERQRTGMSLAAAIRSVVNTSPAESHASLFAAVAAASDRPAVRFSRRAMLAISRSIEDASLAAGGSDAIVGSFQSEPKYRRNQSRWREMARSARTCVVLADFERTDTDERPIEIAIHDDSPLAREWAVAVAGPSLTACLAGWEWPAPNRGFEAVWSVDPDVTWTAIDRGVAIAQASAPDLVPPLTRSWYNPDTDQVDRVTRLFDRIIQRLQ